MSGRDIVFALVSSERCQLSMNLNPAIFGLFFLLGSLQGILLSIYLFFQSEKPRMRSISLGFLVLILSYDLLETCLNFAQYRPLSVQFLVLLFSFGIGPCLYLYVRSSVRPEESFAKPLWFYFLPIIFQCALRLMVFLAYLIEPSLGNKLYMLHLRLSAPASVIIFWLYLIWSWQFFSVASENDELTQVEQAEVSKWISVFLIVVSGIAMLWTILMLWSILLPQAFQFSYFYPFQIIIVLFVYWVGFKSFQRIKVIYVAAEKTAQAFFSSIPGEEVTRCLLKIKHAFEIEHLHLDSELTLSTFAQKTELKPKLISAVLNQELGKGFKEVVNEYRVEEVKRKLLDNPKNLHITQIAFNSGFNSVPTFQRAFKLHTKLSPKEFIAIHRIR